MSKSFFTWAQNEAWEHSRPDLHPGQHSTGLILPTEDDGARLQTFLDTHPEYRLVLTLYKGEKFVVSNMTRYVQKALRILLKKGMEASS